MITAEQVADHLGHASPAAEVITPAVDAVNHKVAMWHGYLAGDTWTPDHVLGGIMLAAHLVRRRNTPGGVEAFNELGVAYVQRSDPHVSQLLGLGGWTPPRIG